MESNNLNHIIDPNISKDVHVDFNKKEENAIIKNVAKSDIIVGVVAIVVPGSILGELTAKMATAIGESDATRILIPFDSCNTKIAMLSTGSLQMFIDKAVQMTIQRIIELS